jgi:PleD family two-component response regulator
VLFRNATEVQARERVFALLAGLSTAPIVVEGTALRVTASIGVALFTTGEASSGALRRADLALFEAKANGRNRVV